MSEVYNRIEALCKARGVSITRMCRESGASRSALGDLNTGRSETLSTKTLALVADYFGVSIDELMGIKKAPAENGEGATDEAIKFALFGGDGPITDEMYDEVKKFAAYVKERERKKNDN